MRNVTEPREPRIIPQSQFRKPLPLSPNPIMALQHARLRDVPQAQFRSVKAAHVALTRGLSEH